MSERLELIKLIADRKASIAWNQQMIANGLPVWGSDPYVEIEKYRAEIAELERQLDLRYPVDKETE